jgi:DNA-binding CsgD family transcriptional regulator
VSAARSGTLHQNRALYPAERRYVIDAANGYTTHQTAVRFGVSRSTVQTSLAHAKRALNAATIAHAVALALYFGEFAVTDIYDRGSVT